MTRSFVLGSQKSTQAQRLGALFATVIALLDEVAPDLVSVEDDTGRNGKTTRVLRGYQAVVDLACHLRGIPCRIDINASRARSLALGHGGLSKEDAAKAAWSLLGIGAPTPDEIDAAILLVATEIALAEESYAAARRTLRMGALKKKRKAA